MTDKKKITLIYLGVGLISVMILGMSFFLTTLKKKQKDQEPPITNVGKEEVDVLNLLRDDIELERQNGGTVKISQLHDKVWVAAQFYAKCPMCAQRNQESLVKIYNDFKEDDDFLVACFSVDPENDTDELLSNIRGVLEVGEEDWWFLKAEQKKLFSFMEDQMGFPPIRRRVDPIHIQQKGEWAHDIGLQLYRGTALVHKWDVAMPLDDLRVEIRKELAKLKELQKTSVTLQQP